MQFTTFDTRNYRTVSVQDGYGEWASTYEDTVFDTMDLRLLERLSSPRWNHLGEAADLGCGTGRIGTWLAQRGVGAIDGVDATPAMLQRARAKGVYRALVCGEILATPLAAAAYDLVSIVLVDEHLPALQPLYEEGARIVRPGGYLVLVGYHPFFLMSGIPTHFNSTSGEPITIECYVHLTSSHVQAAIGAGWTLREMQEGLIDAEWLLRKPKWRQYQHRPVSFAMVWQK
ncbi:MAG TPA: class I SAM-dependent methyltransferase [Dehalococcoidia bacterium]|jgi:SAM-dependent methyltransferase